MRTVFVYAAMLFAVCVIVFPGLARAGDCLQVVPQNSFVTTTFPVDYGVSPLSIVSEGFNGGLYYSVDPRITSGFFPESAEKGMHTIRVRIFMRTREASVRQVVAAMKRRGFRPANLQELLAFGSWYLSNADDVVLVALGTSVGEHPRLFPALHSEQGWGALDVVSHVGSRAYQFLGVAEKGRAP